MTLRPSRVRKCANPACRQAFEKRNAFQRVCSPTCAVAYVQSQKQREERKADRQRREALKTRKDYLKDAQAAFNAWVKARDAHLPCVSCGRHHTGAYHAGHYLSVGARPELRFEPLNCWKQCAPCNTYLSGNLVLYRQELIKRIGADKVAWLEGPHETPKLTADDLKTMAKIYRAWTRELKRGHQQRSA